jgi:hypothetical protein
MTSRICYPLVVFYDPTSRECAAKRDAGGRCWTGIVALEAAYRAAWDGEVSL